MQGIRRIEMQELLQQIVCLHGVQVGHVVDVIFDSSENLIGLEVRCKDGVHRFLPMAAVSESSGKEIVIDSPFALLDGDQLAFYRERGVTLRTRL